MTILYHKKVKKKILFSLLAKKEENISKYTTHTQTLLPHLLDKILAFIV